MSQLRQTPPREDLCRTAPFELLRAEGDPGDGLTIEGYGAVFNAVTRIDSWEGLFDEMILLGAFRKTLRERTPKMQFDHGRHPLLGSLPLGRWTIAEEDDRGMHLVGRLTDNWLIQPFRDAIRDGGVVGMSFRFSVEKDKWFDAKGVEIKSTDELMELLYSSGERGPLLRKLIEVKASEAGPVAWPAYEETSVGVRSVTIDLGRLAEPAERDKVAHLMYQVDAAWPSPLTIATHSNHTRYIPQTSGSSESEQQDKPPTTEAPADEHSRSEPPVTEEPAGEHSSATTHDQLSLTEMVSKAGAVTASIEEQFRARPDLLPPETLRSRVRIRKD